MGFMKLSSIKIGQYVDTLIYNRTNNIGIYTFIFVNYNQLVAPWVRQL